MSRATRASAPHITAENGVSSVGVKKASSSGNAVVGTSAVNKAAKRRPRASSPGTTVSATTESSGSTMVSPRRTNQSSPRGSVASTTPRGEKRQSATSSRPVTAQKVSSNTSQARVSSGDVKRMSRPKATAQPKTSPAPVPTDPPEVTSTDVVSPRTTQQVTSMNADTAAKAVASAVAAATSAARRVWAPEISLEVPVSGDKMVLGASLTETLPSTVTETTSDIKISSEFLEEEVLNPPALIADVGGTTGLSGEGQSGTSPVEIFPRQQDAGDPMSTPPAEDLQEELPSTSANIQPSLVSAEEVFSTFQQLPIITPTKQPEEENEHEIYGELRAEVFDAEFAVPLEATTAPAVTVDIADPQVCRERSVLGQVTVEALCAENQRLRDEVERQRIQLELLAASKGAQSAVHADIECDVLVGAIERETPRDHETMLSYELLQSASSNLAASFKADNVARAPKAVVYVAPPANDVATNIAAPAGIPKIVAPSTAVGSTTPGYPMPVTTGLMSPRVPTFAGSLGGKGGLVQLAGSAITPRVLTSPRLGATGTNSVPAPSTGMSGRFVQKDSARAPVAVASPHISMRPVPVRADSIRAPVAVPPQMQASSVQSPRYYDRSLSPISRNRGLVQLAVPQAQAPQPQQIAPTVAPTSSVWSTEAMQLQGRATGSAITGASNAPAQLPRRNGNAYRMVSSEGVAYQYAAPPFSISQPNCEVARMRSSECERLLSPAPLARKPQLERRVEGIASAIPATFL